VGGDRGGQEGEEGREEEGREGKGGEATGGKEREGTPKSWPMFEILKNTLPIRQNVIVLNTHMRW